MKYTYKYFKDAMPDWKRKKDPILSRLFYRRAAFLTASICANVGISANTVSYASAILGVIACGLFLVNNHVATIIGAVLVNIWLIMDCTDGNLARTVKKQPFGEFADGVSGYILMGLLCTCMGFSAYRTGGIIFEAGNPWIILIGAFASSSDSLMRLIYQKYKATAQEMVDAGVMEKEEDKRTDKSQVRSFRVRVEAEMSLGGILPLLCLLGAIFNAVDLVVIYCFLICVLSFVVMTMMYVMKAIKHTRDYENRGV